LRGESRNLLRPIIDKTDKGKEKRKATSRAIPGKGGKGKGLVALARCSVREAYFVSKKMREGKYREDQKKLHFPSQKWAT